MFEIAAVTSPSGFCAVKIPKDACWHASIGITAWQDITGGKIHTEENWRLTKKVENANELAPKLKRNSIITVKVRKSDKSFLIVDITNRENKFPELEKILAEQLQPVYYIDEVLGKFTLEKSVNTFEQEIEWRGEKVRLSFDNDIEEEMSKYLSVARKLIENQEEWDNRIRDYAAEELIELANDWLDEDEDEGEITEEEFRERISLDEISIEHDGDFIFWFDDDKIFTDQYIYVDGNIIDGLIEAGIEE